MLNVCSYNGRLISSIIKVLISIIGVCFVLNVWVDYVFLYNKGNKFVLSFVDVMFQITKQSMIDTK